MLKIFEIRWITENQKSWIAAMSLIHAIQTYCSVTGLDLHEFDITDEIVELPEVVWREYTVTHEDAANNQTFLQWMLENKTADIIAETHFDFNQNETDNELKISVQK